MAPPPLLAGAPTRSLLGKAWNDDAGHAVLFVDDDDGVAVGVDVEILVCDADGVAVGNGVGDGVGDCVGDDGGPTQ